MTDTVLSAAAPAAHRFVALATAVAKPGQTVPSPCVNVCRMSATSGLCEGCWRTVDEIRAWSRSDDDAKLAIWSRVEARQTEAGLRR
jgi:uncharacterized protein